MIWQRGVSRLAKVEIDVRFFKPNKNPARCCHLILQGLFLFFLKNDPLSKKGIFKQKIYFLKGKALTLRPIW